MKGRDLRLLLAGAAAGVLLAFVASVVFMASAGGFSDPDYARAISLEEPKASPPLAKIRVTKHWDTTTEIFATLSPGMLLSDAIDLTVFDGFEPRMTSEEALDRHGEPSGRWLDPYYRIGAPYYDVPHGRVSLCHVPGSGGPRWNTVAYPKVCSPEAIFKDSRLTEQLLSLLPPFGDVAVHVLRQSGSGGVSVDMTKTDCRTLVLTARDE
jgi:hypothetical protein